MILLFQSQKLVSPLLESNNPKLKKHVNINLNSNNLNIMNLNLSQNLIQLLTILQ